MFQSSLLYITECVKGLEYVKADADNLTVHAYSFDLKTKGTAVVYSIMRARMWPHVHNFGDLCPTQHVKCLANQRVTGWPGLAWMAWPGLDDNKFVMSSPCTQHMRRDDLRSIWFM